jgi:hypothetical protein
MDGNGNSAQADTRYWLQQICFCGKKKRWLYKIAMWIIDFFLIPDLDRSQGISRMVGQSEVYNERVNLPNIPEDLRIWQALIVA